MRGLLDHTPVQRYVTIAAPPKLTHNIHTTKAGIPIFGDGENITAITPTNKPISQNIVIAMLAALNSQSYSISVTAVIAVAI